MSKPEGLPPARERNRHGIRPFTVDHPATADTALFDRLALRLRGRVTARSHNGVQSYVDAIGTETPSPLFERVRREKGRWASKVRSGTTISAAKLALWDDGNMGGIDLELSVNPIRTLSHLLDRYEYAEISDLSPTAFFEKRPSAKAKSLTLDGNDNMVANFLAFGSSLQATYVQRVAEYLRRFEANLLARLMEGLCPAELGFDVRVEGRNAIGENDLVRVELEWSTLTVSQCEVCWEWHDPHALSKVHALADGAITAARSTEVSFFDRPTISRELGALAVRLPLPTDVTIVVYAKANDRLRIEVRYPKGVASIIEGSLAPAPRLLSDWLTALSNHASARVPWASLHALLATPPEASHDALAELMASVADATEGCKSKRQGLLLDLLRHGAVTGTSRDGPAPYRVLEKLAERGIVEHVRLVKRDAKQGRRYRLSPRYIGLIRDP